MEGGSERREKREQGIPSNRASPVPPARSHSPPRKWERKGGSSKRHSPEERPVVKRRSPPLKMTPVTPPRSSSPPPKQKPSKPPLEEGELSEGEIVSD